MASFLPLHNASRLLRQSPQNAVVSATSFQTIKVGHQAAVTTHMLQQPKDQSLAHVRISKPRQGLQKVRTVQSGTKEKHFNYWINNETYHNCMDHKTTHTAILGRQVQISKEDILRGFYMLPRTSAQQPSQRIGKPNNV